MFGFVSGGGLCPQEFLRGGGSNITFYIAAKSILPCRGRQSLLTLQVYQSEVETNLLHCF